MQGSSAPAPDDAWISGAAALAALGGHAAILLAVLLWASRAPPVVIAPTVVGVTLVSGSADGGTSSTPAGPAQPTASPDTPTPQTSSQERMLSGDGLDSLTAPSPSSSTSASASPSPATATSARQGSSRAGQGLGKGEGAEGIDLYAAASLPSVGVRPNAPPSGDLWQRVAPCWRPASPRQATLIIEIRSDGGLAASPRAVRRGATPADPQTLLAERAAARALQACAPYAGLEARQWRVEFPG
jgi:hypothetical protein